MDFKFETYLTTEVTQGYILSYFEPATRCFFYLEVCSVSLHSELDGFLQTSFYEDLSQITQVRLVKSQPSR